MFLSDNANQIIEKAIDDLIEEVGGIEEFASTHVRFAVERKIRSTVLQKVGVFRNSQADSNLPF